MRHAYKVFASLGVIGMLAWTLLMVGIGLALFGTTIYGLYLAFSASIILGIIVLFVQPAPFIIGAVMLFYHKDLALMIVDFLTK